MGRRAGATNRGYFYRTGRGWYTTAGERMIALLDDDGNRLRDKATPATVLKKAYHKIIVASATTVNSGPVPPKSESVKPACTVADVCSAYLAKAESDESQTTYNMRADTLFDFCTGFPARFRVRKKGEEPPRKKVSDRIHKGYGDVLISDFLPLHVDQWLAAHKGWNGSRRTHIKAIKRAMNYGVECGLIPETPGSPIKNYKVPRAVARITYITPEQEKAILKVVKPAFAMAFKVCLRTGMRPGSEFAKLTASQVKTRDRGMQLILSPRQHKTGHQTGKQRIIWITDQEITQTICDQIKKYPKGEIFRNSRGTKWTYSILSLNFRRAKERLQRDGIELDEDAVMYSTRHTYAKRTLQGYWSGTPTTIENLARLMGNSPQVCRDHYLQWTKSYEEVLWDCA